MKRIFALVLSLLIVFSAMPFVSAEEDKNTDLEFAMAMGFIGESEDIYPDDVLTRIQLAEIFYNIVFDKNLQFGKEYESVNFPDVPEEKKPIVSMVYGMGVMRGYSDSVFAPDDPVTYSQLIKTFVAFLGYDALAQFRGGYPSGYLTVAANLKILPEYIVSNDSVATIGAACELLKKCSVVDIGIPTPEGGYYVNEGVSYLEYYKEVKVGKGTITGNYLTNINEDELTGYFSVLINDEKMFVAGTAAGIQNYLGYEVYVYYEDVDNVKTIVYYELGNNSVLELSAEKISYVSNRTIAYFEGFDTLKVNISQTADVLYNGSHLASYTAADINPFEAENLDGSIRLVDKDFDSIYDTVIVTAFKTYVVRDVVNLKIYNEYIPSDVVNISNYKERNIDIVNVIGEPVEPEAIKAGHIVNVCYDRSGNIKRVIVSKDSIIGTIDEISYVGSKISAVKVGGTTFEVANGLTLVDSANRLKAGCNVKVYMNCENRIAVIDVDSEFVNGYTRGLLIDMATEGGVGNKTIVRLFQSDGAMHDYTLPERVSLGGTMVDSSSLESGVFGLDTDGEVRRQVILFKPDEAEPTIIKNIITADTSGNFSDGFYQFYNESGGTVFSYKGGMRTFDDKFGYDVNSTLVMAMPELEKRHNYEEYTVSEMGVTEGSSRSELNALIYGTSKDGLLADTIVIDASNASTTITDPDKRPTMMIDRITEVYDAESGEIRVKVNGTYIETTTAYTGGFTTTREALLEACGGKMPQQGDIYRWQYFRTTGEIKKFNSTYDFVIFDKAEKELGNGENPKTYPDTCAFNYGKVIEKNGPMIKVELYNSTRDKKVYMLNAGYYRFIEHRETKKGEVQISVKDYECILPESTNPDNPSEVIVFHRASGIGVFIYNKEV